MAQRSHGVQFEEGVEIQPSGPLSVYQMEAPPPRFGLLKSLLAGELPESPPDEHDQCDPDPEVSTHVARFRVNGSGFEIYPSFTGLSRFEERPFPASDILEAARRKILEAVVPKDEFSKATVEEGRVLSRARRNPEAPLARVSKAQVLLYVSARRRVDELPVDGPGSRITIALDAEHRVHGAVYDWNLPVPLTRIPAPAPDKVRAEIEAQLSATKPRKGARIKKVQLAYYDDGQALHPVYRYVAEFGQDKKSCGAPDITVSYVPFDPDAGVPRLGRPPSTQKRAAGAPKGPNPAGATTKLAVGRYTARELSTGWTESSEAFMAALDAAPGPFTFFDDRPTPANPAVFTTNRRELVDSVDVALLEAHGFDMGFVTLGDDSDPVFIERDVAPLGYGRAKQGKLKHWILHSCTAVGTEADYPGWADHWGPLFKGLSSVVGYRSAMFVSDGAPAAFAASLAAGAPVASAWINAVTSLNIYARDSGVMLRCAGSKNLGRAAAVIPCNHGDDTAADAGPNAAECLESWWIEDEIHTPTGTIGAQEPCSDCPEMGAGGIGNYPRRGK